MFVHKVKLRCFYPVTDHFDEVQLANQRHSHGANSDAPGASNSDTEGYL